MEAEAEGLGEERAGALLNDKGVCPLLLRDSSAVLRPVLFDIFHPLVNIAGKEQWRVDSQLHRQLQFPTLDDIFC